MPRIAIFVSFLSCSLMTSVSEAQLFRGNAAPPAAREPARVGLLGGIREAREERFRREEQAAAAAARAAVAQRNAAIASRANPNAAAQQPATAASNTSKRPDATKNPLNANPTTKTDPNNRSASFRGPSGTTPNPKNTLSRPTPATSSAAVTTASATAFVPPPVGYDGQEYYGPGVVIRLPEEARSVVNFLVDETESSAVRPGEEQVLDSKGSYVIRYSRGVTRDGRSFGESRYTVTEGRYRFELTATGWELYRETNAEINSVPLNSLDIAEYPAGGNPVGDRQLNEQVSPQPSSQSELLRTSPSQSVDRPEPIINKPVAGTPATGEPQTAPAANEEVLPAPKPRSILEE